MLKILTVKLILILALGYNYSMAQTIDTVFFENFIQESKTVVLPSETELNNFGSYENYYRILNRDKDDTLRVLFEIPVLKKDSFALVVKSANLNNKKKVYYRVDKLMNDSIIHNQNWWRLNPEYYVGLGSLKDSCLISVELKSIDTIGLYNERRLCFRPFTNGIHKKESVEQFKVVENKRAQVEDGFNTFSFVKLGSTVSFFDRGYRHYFKVGYSNTPKGELCSFEIGEQLNFFVVDVAPGSDVLLSYILVTVP